MEFREDGDERFPEHFGGEPGILVVPSALVPVRRIGVADDFGRIDDDESLQAGAQRVVARGDLPEDGAVGPDDFQGLGRVAGVAGDGPHQGVVIRRIEVILAGPFGVAVFIGP